MHQSISSLLFPLSLSVLPPVTLLLLSLPWAFRFFLYVVFVFPCLVSRAFLIAFRSFSAMFYWLSALARLTDAVLAWVIVMTDFPVAAQIILRPFIRFQLCANRCRLKWRAERSGTSSLRLVVLASSRVAQFLTVFLERTKGRVEAQPLSEACLVTVRFPATR